METPVLAPQPITSILGHCYGACTWLTNRWHLGTAGAVGYAMIVSACIVLLTFPGGPPVEAGRSRP
jgi:hypothetical protein